MKIESPAALRFILDEDIYLLNKDKNVTNFPAQSTAEEPAGIPSPSFKYLGDNKKGFLIIVNYSDNEFIADEHLISLENILKRKEFLLADVAILNLANYAGSAFEEITGYFKPKKILLMGEEALPANMPVLTLNQPQDLGGCASLYSFSFGQMMDSTDNKKVFWDKMKNL